MNSFTSRQPPDILIVDDTPENLRLLSTMLNQYGYKVRKVMSGEMALKVVKNATPDLILLDIGLPEMNGYEVCQQIKSMPESQDIPVIFLSAYDQTEQKIKAFAVGGVDYITKPFQLAEVKARIETHLQLRELQKAYSRLVEELQEKNQKLQQKIEDHEAEIIRRKIVEKELNKVNQELEKLANFDPLTGLANRRKFDQMIRLEWRRLLQEKAYMTIILCDIDSFKNYNDTYGHQAGDECLAQVAQAIQQQVKRSHDLVARYGGEEFIILLPNTDQAGALTIAEQMRQAVIDLQIQHSTSAVAPLVTLSLGIFSQIPNLESTLENVIYKADQALYLAKTQGRNQVVAYHE